MTFPASPINGATTTVNGISYTYNSSINSWKRSIIGIGDVQANLGNATTNITTLFSNTATQAASINSIDANVGSFQTYANTKIGTNTNGNLVVVATTPSTDATTGALVVRGGAGIGGDMHIAGNIVPAANVTYDLGSSTTWFRDLWLSAGTIHIGGAKITQDPASGAIAIVPKATANNPNPKATIFSATGAVITANTAAGIISSETIATAAASTDFNVIGNLTANTATIAGNIFANKFYTTNGLYWAGNGIAFSSGASFTASSTAPATPAAGEQWYDTVNDILYEFIEDYWVDIQSATISIGDYNNVTVENISANGNITTANIYADRFFYSNGAAFSSSNYGNTEVVAYLAANPQGSTYSNTNVEAYLGANLGTATTNITTLFSNAATQATSINSVNANIGAFQTYANTAFNYGNTQVASYFTSNVSGVAATTGALNVPVGTTAQRPATTSNGAIRYNTTMGRIEAYMYAGGWVGIVSDSYSVEYLVVAGGGGGGYDRGAGGGAGGLLTATGFTVTPTTAYTVTVGAGGNGQTGYSPSYSGNGANSIFSSFTAIGGGGALVAPGAVGSGGSGGGGYGQGPNDIGGAGTPGQGYSGGNGTSSGYRSGGGGGAGGSGGLSPSNSTAGLGGPGAVSLISGSSVTYSGGGSGGGNYGASIPGGSGGGGASGGQGENGTAGTTNLGGGGGGGGNQPQGAGGNGGSGIVIIRYLGSQRGTGGTITTGGGYTVHTFTGSGTFTA
jgi:hypothetical protein